MGATNIYSLTSLTGVLDPTAASTAFTATLSGGNIQNGPTFTTNPGTTAKADIAAIAGATSLALPFYGIGKANANGDISQFSSFGGAISVTGGTEFDLALSGPGIDTTIQIAYIGTNVTIADPPRDSSGGTVNGNPIIRQHLSIGTQTTATMGTIWIIKGTVVPPLTGILDIEPSTPVISSVQDAESAGKTITSGQYIAIYGANFANSTRIWNTATDFTGGGSGGKPAASESRWRVGYGQWATRRRLLHLFDAIRIRSMPLHPRISHPARHRLWLQTIFRRARRTAVRSGRSGGAFVLYLCIRHEFLPGRGSPEWPPGKRFREGASGRDDSDVR